MSGFIFNNELNINLNAAVSQAATSQVSTYDFVLNVSISGAGTALTTANIGDDSLNSLFKYRYYYQNPNYALPANSTAQVDGAGRPKYLSVLELNENLFYNSSLNEEDGTTEQNNIFNDWLSLGLVSVLNDDKVSYDARGTTDLAEPLNNYLTQNNDTTFEEDVNNDPSEFNQADLYSGYAGLAMVSAVVFRDPDSNAAFGQSTANNFTSLESGFGNTLVQNIIDNFVTGSNETVVSSSDSSTNLQNFKPIYESMVTTQEEKIPTSAHDNNLRSNQVKTYVKDLATKQIDFYYYDLNAAEMVFSIPIVLSGNLGVDVTSINQDGDPSETTANVTSAFALYSSISNDITHFNLITNEQNPTTTYNVRILLQLLP